MLLVRIIVLLTILAPLTLVNAQIQQCQKIIVAGNIQWPPYTILASRETDDIQDSSVNLQGIGMDIAKQIFAELDVPVEEALYSDPSQMAAGLRDGTIDLIVNTYNDSSLLAYATIVQPSYINDPITIAMPISASKNITDWDSLVGLSGVKEISLTPDDQVNDFFISYLQITNKANLLANLEAVKNSEYQYIVGSDLQLTYAINNNNLNSDLIVMKNLNKPAQVHMAFASDSPCKLYAVYLQKRLQDYKNNGTVEKIMKKYRY